MADAADPLMSQRWANLADPRLGAAVIDATDDFFAPGERMLDPRPPIFIPDKYDDHGKWMDGWETRRRRDGAHDHCVIALGRPGRIHAIEFDTRHFTGNYPPAASIEGCFVEGEPDAQTRWTEIVAPVDLAGDDRQLVEVDDEARYSHLRLHLYPDGGIARLRVYGEVRVDPAALAGGHVIDLAALGNGGRVIACNDAHFGSPWNLLNPGRGVNMGDGWETRRRREPGHDWVIVALGCPGLIERVEIDTAHFKGNFPDRCALQAANMQAATDRALITQAMFWPEVLAPQPLSADAEHAFTALTMDGPVTHVKLNILPDGGVSRLRILGRPA